MYVTFEDFQRGCGRQGSSTKRFFDEVFLPCATNYPRLRCGPWCNAKVFYNLGPKGYNKDPLDRLLQSALTSAAPHVKVDIPDTFLEVVAPRWDDAVASVVFCWLLAVRDEAAPCCGVPRVHDVPSMDIKQEVYNMLMLEVAPEVFEVEWASKPMNDHHQCVLPYMRWACTQY